jgi:hypothetical protein
MLKTKIIIKRQKNVDYQKEGEEKKKNDANKRLEKGCNCNHLNCATDICGCRRAKRQCTNACNCVKANCQNLSR